MEEIRRKDRETSIQEALSILNNAEYGVLSTATQEGIPYGVPLSFCLVNGHVYFHCALEGRKIDNLETNSSVSFCAVGDTEVLPERFGTKYQSTIVSGEAKEVFADEKQMALEGLVKKYSSDFIDSGAQYIDALTDRTRVFKIVINQVSGKSRKK